MAESVARVKILAQIEGLEGFDKLKGAFKGLQQAIGPADADLAKARKEILAFGKAGAQTEQVLKGQVEALRSLQSQAVIGGAVYRQLGKDVKALGGAYKEAAGGVKEFSDAQLRSQIVGAKPATFDRQIAALRRGLQDLSVYGRQYTEALTEIQRRQLPFNAAVGRQNVIAGFEAYRQGGKGGSALPELPNTTAGLSQRLAELNAELVNLSRGGTDWIRVSREIANVQRQLNQEFANPAVEAARRRLEASRNTSSGFLEFSSGIEDRDAVLRSIERNRRKREREAARRSGALADQPPAPSQLFQNIAGISTQTAANQVQLMGRSYNEVAESIRRATAASDGSINSLRAQRTAWESLRNSVGNNKTALREISVELNKVDRQLEKRGVGGNRGGAAQIGQGLGALAASGIFGGPAGFIGSAGGAAIGGAFGGPAGFATGAFIGGSVGAYGNMALQGLGEMSTYAADIQKQEIALKGITKTQEEYARALAASAAVTRDFNVPQLEATRGMTQLSAAVVGAGGKVADAEVVFRNTTAAIKASGGTSEDVQGALTALGQIFSKGKVSAEELQGQLGERLPGAVTMFAKATGRTLPQLQKDLEQGVVGLADLMKFVVSEQGLGQFENRAKSVAQSSAEAGARLTVTWNETRRAIGEALLPLTAQIQDSLGNALRDATPALVSFAQGLAGAIKIMVDNGPLIAGTLKTLLGFGAVAGAAVGAIKLAGAIGFVVGAISKAALAVELLGGAMSVATLAARGLSLAFASIPVIGWIGAGVTALGLLTVELYNNNKAFKTWANNYATIIATDFKKAWDDAVTIVSAAKKEISLVLDGIGNLASGLGKIINEKLDGALGGALKKIQDFWNSIPEPVRNLMAKGATDAVGGLVSQGNPVTSYLIGAGIRATQAPPEPSGIAGGRYIPGSMQTPIKEDKLSDWDIAQQQQKKDKEAADRQRAADQEQQRQEALARARIALDDAVHRNAMDLIRKRYEYEQELAGKQRDNWTKQYSGAARGAASQVVQFLNEIDNLNRRNFEAAQKTEQAKLAYSTASQRSEFMGQGGRYIQGGIGPKGPDTYGKHFDIKRSDYGYFDRKSLDQYVQVNGMPLSSGTTVAGGEFGASRWYGKHMGRDYAFGGQAALTLTNGAKWIGNTKTKDGDQAAFMTPDGKVYKILHGKFEPPAVMVDSKKGAAALQRKAVGAAGKATVESIGYDAATESQKATQDQIKLITEQVGKGFVLDTTAELRDQITAQKQLNDELELRNSLEASGMRTEFIDAELEKGKAFEKVSAQANTYSDALQILEDNQLGGSAAANRLRDAIQELFVKFNLLTPEIDKYAKKQAEANDKANGFGEKAKQSIKSYYEELKNFGGSVGNAIVNTFKGLEDQLVNFVVTGKANFKELARSILADMARIALQQAIIKPLVGAIGNLFPGPKLNAMGNVYAKNGIQPFAMGGIVDKPTLFKFAKGTGLMGEAGPEAIIPLKRGADGKLGVSGGGGSTTVNVSVDAKGTSVQGDSNRGDALGRAVAAAVQQELIKQKRPGGLLVS